MLVASADYLFQVSCRVCVGENERCIGLAQSDSVPQRLPMWPFIWLGLSTINIDVVCAGVIRTIVVPVASL